MKRVNRVINHLQPSVGSNQLNREDCAFLDNVVAAPPDAILGMKALFFKDKDPRKINVSVGAYRTDEGKPYVLQCVKEAEKIIQANKNLNKEYLPQQGDQEFAALARNMLFGSKCAAVIEKRVCTVQTLSGTGSLRVGAEFIKRFLPGRTVFTSTPTWGTHNSILKHASVPGSTYRYWDAKGRCLDIDGMLEDIARSPWGSIFLLHPAAHNPTGMDPTKEQWKLISKACAANGIICWFDSAYQGFATGDLDRDAFAIQYFTDGGHPVLASQSFAKNFGLYGERIGTFSAVCARACQVDAVMSNLKIIIRNLYSNPPLHGALIVKTVLKSAELTQMWRDELKAMSDRIVKMRQTLVSELKRLGTPGDWSHITTQIGMFSFTGLNKAQCENMITKHHIYMLKNGRISMAGVNSKNAVYIATAIDETVRNIK